MLILKRSCLATFFVAARFLSVAVLVVRLLLKISKLLESHSNMHVLIQ